MVKGNVDGCAATLHADANDSGRRYSATRADTATDSTIDSSDDYDCPGLCHRRTGNARHTLCPSGNCIAFS